VLRQMLFGGRLVDRARITRHMQAIAADRQTKRQRLAMKMATGSGKTMAMSLCIAWSYFHACREVESPMTTSFPT